VDLNVDRLKEVLKSVGCEVQEQSTEYYIMLPDNFPWYGDHDKHERNNSRIVAEVSCSFGDWKWTEAWPWPDIRTWNDEPLGIEMRRGLVYTGALNELNDSNYEEIANWLQNKIGEVSRVAKKFRKMELEYHSKGYEV
jgi:hypothetical protein